jgi:thioredoxin reductase (NADPH)
MFFSDTESIDVTETAPQWQRLVPENNDEFDVIVIGAGPAGMSAAICAARADLKTLVVEKALPGGECSTACEITNYVGHPKKILGAQLSLQMEEQLFEHAVYYTCETVVDFINWQAPLKSIATALGNMYRTKTIILAIGLEPKKLQASFEEQFMGRGVSYYAQANPTLYTDKNVVVIGGGNCACYAADYLSKYVNHVYMVHNYDTLRAVKTLKKTIEANTAITLMWHSKVTNVLGVDSVERVCTQNTITGQSTWLDAKGVFIYIGRVPPQDIVRFDLDLDEDGFIITDAYMRTNIPGVYAAGDIRSKQVRQIATAVSDGMVAAINIERDYFR